jgi:nitrate reductase gamma subunit
MKTNFLFRVWPYVAVLLFLGWLALRYVLMRKRLDASGSELAEARDLFGGGKLWRISLLLLLSGHLAGLLFPREILLWNVMPVRLYVLEGAGFAVGLAAFAGWAKLTWRHLGKSEAPVASQLADASFLSLLFTAFLSGLLTAVFYRWGSSWGVLTLTPYVSSLFRGNPASALASEMPFLVQLHVFSALAALAILPFTRVTPLLTVPLHYGLKFILRPVSGLAQSSQKALELAAQKYNPGQRIWPEEE